jgi:hypothetical protein
MYMIASSQTWHEYGKNIHLYNSHKNVQANLEVIFGKRWYFILFSPLVSSPPLGDGMSFDTIMTQPGDTRRTGGTKSI